MTRENEVEMFTTLIVEDNGFFRRLLKESLSSRFPSMEIQEADDGEDAFLRIMDRVPDLIFMDINLPGDNGLELTKKIKTKFPNVIVIILTNYDYPEYREAASRFQANYLLSKKSTSYENILALVKSILSDRNRD